MDVSIIICTRDRAESLRDTLVSLAAVKTSVEFSVELLVIDNGSHDHTRAVVEASRQMLSAFTVQYEFEPNGGQAVARNTGLRLSRGDAILFTDDDVRFPANWIVDMTAPLLADQTDAIAGGVRLAPHLCRSWMTPVHRSWLASTECVDPQTPWLVGANMAFARKVLDRVSGFDPQLGPGAAGFEDDVRFGDDLRQAGFRISSRLDVCVEHHFAPDRLLSSSFHAAAVKHGRTMAYSFKQRKTVLNLPFLRRIKFLILTIPIRIRVRHKLNLSMPLSESDLDFIRANAFWKFHAQ